jgi:AraC-like DNA-binding protein
VLSLQASRHRHNACCIQELTTALKSACPAGRLCAVKRRDCRSEFLARGFAESKRRTPPELTWAWGALDQSHGQVPIRALARAVGWSERHLINQFRVYFGVRPKTTARRLRFSYAFDMLATHPTTDFSTIAAQTGYSDQSHMTREFQTFSGVSPGVLRTARFDDLPGIPAGVLLNP